MVSVFNRQSVQLAIAPVRRYFPVPQAINPTGLWQTSPGISPPWGFHGAQCFVGVQNGEILTGSVIAYRLPHLFSEMCFIARPQDRGVMAHKSSRFTYSSNERSRIVGYVLCQGSTEGLT